MTENSQAISTVNLEEMAAQLMSLTKLVQKQAQQIKQLKSELTQQRQQLDLLTNPTAVTNSIPEKTTRRTMLKKLAGGLLAGVGVSLVASAPVAQARIVSNPQNAGSPVGAIIVPNTTTYANQAVQSSAKFGLIVSADPGTLDLSTLPINDVGIYSNCAGTAVYAVCNNRQGIAVQGSNIGTNPSGNGYGVYGVSQNGIGVGGTSMSGSPAIAGNSNTGPGMYGYSISGTGVLAESGNGVPLTIRAGNTPTNGTRVFGDLYVDQTTGIIYAWAKNGSVSNWRPLAFAA